MAFFVNVLPHSEFAVIHEEGCPALERANIRMSNWRGPFDTRAEADDALHAGGRQTCLCRYCDTRISRAEAARIAEASRAARPSRLTG
jgi:hypothetical protein